MLNTSYKLISYVLSQSGQMLRPSLVYFTAYACNPRISPDIREKLIRFAGAVELLHTASLVHDDIIDFSRERRERPSVFGLYGISGALLTGNALYLAAFDLAGGLLDRPQVEGIVLSATEMCCGEFLQMGWKNSRIPKQVYLDIIARKTGSLMKYTCREAARLAGWEARELPRVQRLGECLGVLYQMADDCRDLDVELEPDFSFSAEAERYTREAEGLLRLFDESIYKKALKDFLEHIAGIFAQTAGEGYPGSSRLERKGGLQTDIRGEKPPAAGA